MADDGLLVEAHGGELYVATIDGHEVGRVRVAVADGVWEVYSTHVLESHEGRGIASRMVSAVLDRADAAGVRVIPSCWFVDGFMDRRSPQYDHLRVRGSGTDPAADPSCRIAPAVVRPSW